MGGIFNPLSVLMGQQTNATPMGTVAGAAPPPAPVGSSPFDIAKILEQVTNLPQVSQPLQQLQQAGQQAGTIRQEAAADTPPPAYYHPDYGPWNSVGGALKNVGKGVLEGLSLTGPGKAVYGEPRQREYAGRQAQRAEQLKAIQEGMVAPEEQLKTETGLAGAASLGAYRGGQLGARSREDAVREQRAKTFELAEQHKRELGVEANRIREELGKGRLSVEQARTQMMDTISKRHDSMMRDISANVIDKDEAISSQRTAEEDFKTESDHLLQTILGLGPSKPVTPAGGGRSNKPSARSAAPSQPVYARNPQTGHRVMSTDGGKTWQEAK